MKPDPSTMRQAAEWLRAYEPSQPDDDVAAQLDAVAQWLESMAQRAEFDAAVARIQKDTGADRKAVRESLWEIQRRGAHP